MKDRPKIYDRYSKSCIKKIKKPFKKMTNGNNKKRKRKKKNTPIDCY